MADLAQVIKKAAVDAVKASYPVEVVYGSVVTAEPLTVKIGQQLTVEKNFLNLSDGIRISIASGKITPEDRIILIKHQGGQRFTAIDVFHDEEWEPELFEETDPTVPAWAKAPQKPSYTAAEVGALPITGGTMTGNIALAKHNLTPVETHKLIFQRAEGNEYETRIDVRNDVLRVYTYDKNNNLSFPLKVDLTTGSTIVTDLSFDASSSVRKAADGSFVTAGSFPMTGGQGVYAVRQMGDTWDVTVRGTFSFTRPSTNDYEYGIDLKLIAEAFGFTTWQLCSSHVSSFRIWDRDNGNAEKTALYGFGPALSISSSKQRIIFGRYYSVAETGRLNYGGWGTNNIPENTLFEAHFNVVFG